LISHADTIATSAGWTGPAWQLGVLIASTLLSALLALLIFLARRNAASGDKLDRALARGIDDKLDIIRVSVDELKVTTEQRFNRLDREVAEIRRDHREIDRRVTVLETLGAPRPASVRRGGGA